MGNIEQRIYNQSGKALCMHLIIRKFTADFLGKGFCKVTLGFRSYFIFVQQVIERMNIKQSSLDVDLEEFNSFHATGLFRCPLRGFWCSLRGVSKTNSGMKWVNGKSGHQGVSYSYLFRMEWSETFNKLPELELSIPTDTKCT